MKLPEDPSDQLADAPSRRELRAALAPYIRTNTGVALAWLILDVAIFAALSIAVVHPIGILWKVVASPILGLWIARLFVIGHDACHQALTPHRALNRMLGRIAFLPSLTPYSLWELGHNVAHHGFSNLRGRDSVWVPMSATEFLALPPWRQWLERAYRSGWGPGLYYLIEQWWKKLFFPWANEAGGLRRVFGRDRWLVTGFGVCWIAALVLGAWRLDASPLEAFLFGWLVPYGVWNTLVGFITYVHHTDPNVQWFDDGTAWAAARPYIGTTLHVQCGILDRLGHNILQHPAHHLDMTIPFYRLRAAQRALAALAPLHVQSSAMSWRHYWLVARTCKVYDYALRKWEPFPGVPAGSATGSHSATAR